MRCATAFFAAGGGEDQRGLGPGAVHGIEEHPGAAIGETKAAGGFGEAAVGGDLFEEVCAGLGEGGAATAAAPRVEPVGAAELERRVCRGGGGGFRRAAGARGFAGFIHRRWRS